MAKILLIETSSEVCSAAISVDGQVVALSENLDVQSHAALLTLQIRECSELAGIPLAQLDAIAVSQGPGAYTALRVGASVAKGICYALEKPLIAVDTLLALADASREWANSGGLERSQVSSGEFQASSGEFQVSSSEFQNPPSIVPRPSSIVHRPPSPVPRPPSPVYVPMLDARRQEIWLAVYDADLREIAPAQPLILENNSFESFISEQTEGHEINGVVLSGNGMVKTRSGAIFEKVVFSGVGQCSARYLARLAEALFQSADFQDIAYFEPMYMKPPNITTPAKPQF